MLLDELVWIGQATRCSMGSFVFNIAGGCVS